MDTSPHNYGPLASLIGTWEGIKGDDIAPGDDRGTENNKYKERMTFEPIGMVNNHEQTLYGLKYFTEAWRIGEANAFHQEIGYWLWDIKENQVMKSFIVPRGIAVIAGGTAGLGAKSFNLKATLGSATYGICSNKFLDQQFKTVEYTIQINVLGPNEFSYEQDTVIQMPGKPKLFHHTDKNHLSRL